MTLTIEEQVKIVAATRAAMSSILKRYGWYIVPSKSECPALFADASFLEAKKVYYQERSRLATMRHPEENSLRAKVYREAHPDYNREWQHQHPSEIAAYNYKYTQANLDKVLAWSRKRRARLSGCSEHFTQEEFVALCLEQHNECLYCGQLTKLVPDHMIPLSRGGDNTIYNIAPACVRCNQIKGSKTLEEFVGGAELC